MFFSASLSCAVPLNHLKTFYLIKLPHGCSIGPGAPRPSYLLSHQPGFLRIFNTRYDRPGCLLGLLLSLCSAVLKYLRTVSIQFSGRILFFCNLHVWICKNKTEIHVDWHYLWKTETGITWRPYTLYSFLHILMPITFGACLKYWFCSHHSYTLVLMKRTMKGIPTDGTDAVYSHMSQFFQVSEIKNRHKRPALSIENGDSLKTQR